MAHVRLIRSTILASLLLLSLGQTGCSVFSTIGGWISDSYENTVAYFNAYYNAKKIFDDAEAEVLASKSSLKTKAQTPNQPATTGSTAKQKFTTVIDKCSNILSFYPNSSLVNDALFLIGKSFFYQEEYVKAERKFTELMAKKPSASLAFQGQLWLVKALEKESKLDEATSVGQDLATTAAAAGYNNIAGEAHVKLGDIAVTQKNTDNAIAEYMKAVEVSNDGAMQANAELRAGDLYFSIPDYEKAAAAYLGVQKHSPDDYTLYQSQVQAAIALRRAGKTDESAAILRKMQKNYMFLDNRGTIQYELAKTLERAGNFDEAVDWYRLTDTTSSKTEPGAKAAFELGRLYQYTMGNYKDARIAYSHATVGGSPELTADATKKVAAFDNYYRLQMQYLKLDSILAIYDVDSMWVVRDSNKVISSAPATAEHALDAEPRSVRSRRALASGAKDSSIVGAKDTLMIAQKADSTLASRDSAKVLAHKDSLGAKGIPAGSGAQRIIPKPKKDTLIASIGNLSYLLGESFYTDLDVPDSAFYWINQALKLGIDSAKTPRAWYVLAEVARGDSAKKYGNEKDLYKKILDKYPTSTFAEQARIALGFKPTPSRVDPAVQLYAVADSLTYAGKYKEAVDTLGRIITEFSQSALVPKSRFLMAWLYENHLSLPDSAASEYRTLAEKFGTTRFGQAALKRVPPTEAPPAPPLDSTKKSLPDSLKSARGSEVKKQAADSSKAALGPRPKVAADSLEDRRTPQVPDSLRSKNPLVPLRQPQKTAADSLEDRRTVPVPDSLRPKHPLVPMRQPQVEVDTGNGVGRKIK